MPITMKKKVKNTKKNITTKNITKKIKRKNNLRKNRYNTKKQLFDSAKIHPASIILHNQL